MLVDFHVHYALRTASRTGVERLGGVPVFTFNDRLGRVEALAELAERTGVDVCALSSPEAMREGMEHCRRVNAALAEVAAAQPHMAGLAHIVPGDPGCAAELERCARDYGFHGAFVQAVVQGRTLDDPAFEPLYAQLEDLGVYLLVHPPGVPPAHAAPDYDAYDLFRSLGREFYLVMAAVRLVYGGVLDRHPRLRVLLSHLGGGLAAYVGRLTTYGDPAYMGLAADAGDDRQARRAARPLRDYLDRFYYDTAGVGVTGRPIEAALCELPRDRIVFGSDFPQHLRTPELARQGLDAAVARIGRAELEANTARLLA